MSCLALLLATHRIQSVLEVVFGVAGPCLKSAATFVRSHFPGLRHLEGMSERDTEPKPADPQHGRICLFLGYKATLPSAIQLDSPHSRR